MVEKTRVSTNSEKTNTGVYVHNNLFTSVEEKIDIFLSNQYKPFKANNMKQFNEILESHGFCGHCSREAKSHIKMV